MAKGIALLVGLENFDRRYYREDGKCPGCHRDVDSMASLLRAERFEIIALKTHQAPADRVLGNLRQLAATAVAGDIIVFYYSGHGSQQPDGPDRDELDGLDELLCTYDRPILDDELEKIWRQFASGVRIVMIADSCHSGTVSRSVPSETENFAPPILSRRSSDDMRASLLHFGACPDSKKAKCTSAGGFFTIALRTVWGNGSFSGNYNDFGQEIDQQLGPRFGQGRRPLPFGPATDIFRRQRPFAIEAPLLADSSTAHTATDHPLPEPHKKPLDDAVDALLNDDYKPRRPLDDAVDELLNDD